MPGLMDWKTLYSVEYTQLKEEGYQIPEDLKPGENSEYFPFPDLMTDSNSTADASELEWEKAYYRLWSLREKGLRPDYPYVEPNDFTEIIKAAQKVPEIEPVDMERYEEKIKGAWLGRCAGVILGRPFEFNVKLPFIKKYLQSVDAFPLNDFIPAYSEKLDIRLRCPLSTKGNISYVENDDDTRYTILALNLVEEMGLDFTHYDVIHNVVKNVPYTGLWSVMKQSFYHYVNLTSDRPVDEQVKEFALKLNPMREGINATIRADFWGYISPADPRRAASIAHQEASLNSVKNGLYGSMFTAGCIATALGKHPTVESILAGGLSVIPKKSRLAEVVKEVQQWYEEDNKDWMLTCNRIYEKYGHLPFAGGLNNLAICVLALIHGQLDFTKTICTAVMCGVDTDCNAGTVGSIVGAAIGHDRIDQKWIAPFNDTIKTSASCYHVGTISELVKRTISAYEKTKDIERGKVD